MSINMLILAAGSGQRFKDTGYKEDKPLIEIKSNYTMLESTIDNLNYKKDLTFIIVCRSYNKDKFKKILDKKSINYSIITTNEQTEGAACSALLAKNLINNDSQLIVSSIDQCFEIDWNAFEKFAELSKSDGILLTFKVKNDEKWSFVKLENGLVVEVAEKKQISQHGNVGTYFFNKGIDFVKYTEQMIVKNIRTNNEFYIAPIFSEIIADKKKIMNYEVTKMIPLGTPLDLDIYKKC